jgi:hypothetical protein
MNSTVTLAGEFAPFVPYCFLACYAAFLFSRPPRGEAAGVTAAGLALGLALARFHLGPGVAGLGLAAALWVVVARFLKRKTIHPAIVLILGYPALASAALLTIHPSGGMVLDRYLLAADGSFGFQPGFLAAAFLLHHASVKLVCEVCYFGLPVAMVSLFHTASAKQVLGLCLLLGATALPGYWIFPAVGAQPAFHDPFPLRPPATDASFGAPVFVGGGIGRNIMPSLHSAWGIALLLGAWPLGWRWRSGILLYLAPMLLYALSAHYLCDMIVAGPWTFAAASAIGRRWSRLAANLAMVAAWLVVIRFGLPFLYVSAWVPWLLGAASVAGPAVLYRREWRRGWQNRDVLSSS